MSTCDVKVNGEDRQKKRVILEEREREREVGREREREVGRGREREVGRGRERERERERINGAENIISLSLFLSLSPDCTYQTRFWVFFLGPL